MKLFGNVRAVIGLAVIGFAISGCQTARYKEFETIHGGMTKGEVLAAVGGPDRTQRWHGRDRWEYTLYGHPDGDLVREVHFENGKSTYIGPAIKPAISASQQDLMNDQKNRQAELIESANPYLQDTEIEVQRFVPVEP